MDANELTFPFSQHLTLQLSHWVAMVPDNLGLLLFVQLSVS